MIDNDKEFQKAFKEYMKSKGLEGNETCFCGRLQCDDCMLKDVSYNLYDINEVQCSGTPFKEIEKYEKQIKLLRREINIIDSWEKESILSNKLQDVCKEIKRQCHDSGADNLKCDGITCDTCIFNGDTNNFYKWIEDQEKRGKEDDQE